MFRSRSLLARDLKFFWQRKRRGFSEEELWSLDHHLAKLIYPRLKTFKESSPVHPAPYTEDEWKDILQKMIDAFEWAADGGMWKDKLVPIRVEEGLKLFSENFLALNW